MQTKLLALAWHVEQIVIYIYIYIITLCVHYLILSHVDAPIFYLLVDWHAVSSWQTTNGSVFTSKQIALNQISLLPQSHATCKQNIRISLFFRLKMAITNGSRGLAYTIVIVVLIFPQITAQVVFPRDSAAGNIWFL